MSARCSRGPLADRSGWSPPARATVSRSRDNSDGGRAGAQSARRDRPAQSRQRLSAMRLLKALVACSPRAGSVTLVGAACWRYWCGSSGPSVAVDGLRAVGRRAATPALTILGISLLWGASNLWSLRRSRRAARPWSRPSPKPARPDRRCRSSRAARRAPVQGGEGAAQGAALRQRPALRAALVPDDRPARLRQDHGPAPVGPALSARQPAGAEGRRRHAQLRLVLHRRGRAARHRRSMDDPGQRPRRGRGGLARAFSSC